MIQVKKGNFTGCLAQVLPEKQMSEAFINSIFLAMSGGFQDAYTYFTRDKVFSNAQTGNVVLMSQHFMMGEWKDGLKYLLPLLAFAFGVLAAERIQAQFRFARRLHWRQGILLLEIAILLIVGFLPQTLNMTATILVSFSCAMQVQAFRKVDGYSYASTMCIGNLRSGTASNVTKLAPSEKVKIGTRTAHSATEQRLCAVFLKKGMTRKRIEKSAKKSYSKRINYATL